MCWTDIPIRADRRQLYFDALLMAASEAGGPLTLDAFVAEVAQTIEDLPRAGNIRWNTARALAAMVRFGVLRKAGVCEYRLNAAPEGAQQMR